MQKSMREGGEIERECRWGNRGKVGGAYSLDGERSGGEETERSERNKTFSFSLFPFSISISHLLAQLKKQRFWPLHSRTLTREHLFSDKRGKSLYIIIETSLWKHWFWMQLLTPFDGKRLRVKWV